jgi:S-adenosyl-L-methionine hydrolase (adenosine-forming)
VGVPGRKGTRRTGAVRSPLVTLLTDYGLEDVYAGVLKGVIASIVTEARIVDNTHGIPAQDVRRGGLRWASAVPYFPPGTVHVAVVDPGVGGERPIVALRAGGSVFIAPDNGLLGFVAGPAPLREAWRIEDRRWALPGVGRTFHGRDIIAPAAAHVAAGLPPRRLGPAVADVMRLPPSRLLREPRPGGARLRGAIVDIDNFGNCITNIPAGGGDPGLRDIRVGGLRVRGTSRSYDSSRAGAPLAIVGSGGFLEIAVNRGRADRELGLRIGQAVTATERRS